MNWIEYAKTEVGGIVDVPANKSGVWEIKNFTIDEEASLRSMFAYKDRMVPQGTYTVLTEDNQVYMSDTPAEVSDHHDLIVHGKGNVLVMGLGIGLVMEMLMLRLQMGRIGDLGKVVFVEMNQDVIDLVAPHYTAKYPDHFQVVKANALDLDPDDLYAETGVEIWDAIWIDIWADINGDNRDEYEAMLQRWDEHGDWVGLWQQDTVMVSDEEYAENWLNW